MNAGQKFQSLWSQAASFRPSCNSLKEGYLMLFTCYKTLGLISVSFEKFQKFRKIHQKKITFETRVGPELARSCQISILRPGSKRPHKELHLCSKVCHESFCGPSSETSKFLVSGSRGFRRKPIWDPPEPPRNSGGECFAP